MRRLLEAEGGDAERADVVLARERDHPAVAAGHVDDLAVHRELLEVARRALGAVGDRLARAAASGWPPGTSAAGCTSAAPDRPSSRRSCVVPPGLRDRAVATSAVREYRTARRVPRGYAGPHRRRRDDRRRARSGRSSTHGAIARRRVCRRTLSLDARYDVCVYEHAMRRWLIFVLGVIVGQWLAFGGDGVPGRLPRPRPAGLAGSRLPGGHAAVEPRRSPCSRPTRLPVPAGHGAGPAGAAGSRRIDAFQMALLLDPSPALARAGLRRARPARTGRRRPSRPGDDACRSSTACGVWIAQVVVNETHTRALPGRHGLQRHGASRRRSPPRSASPAPGRRLAGGAARPWAARTAGAVGDGGLAAGGRPGDARRPGGAPRSRARAWMASSATRSSSRYRVTVDADRRLLLLRLLAGD